jgi:signal-transduction protein with cAMP-binding, CBS, and nucleotidyltransferase domain
MKKTSSRHIYVTKKGVPLGIISAIDIVNKVVAAGKSAKTTKVENIMNRPIYACMANDSIADAYLKIVKYNVALIPVINGNKIIGLLSSQEVMQHFIKKGNEK